MIDELKKIFDKEFENITNMEKEIADFLEDNEDNKYNMLDDAKKPIKIINDMEKHYLILMDTVSFAISYMNEVRGKYLDGLEVYADDDDETE